MKNVGMQTCRRMLVLPASAAAPRQCTDALQHGPAQRQVSVRRQQRCQLSARAAGDETEASTQPGEATSSSSGATSTGLIDPAAAPADAESRADDVLPDSLTDALEQAAESTLLALQSGSTRCIVRSVFCGATHACLPSRSINCSVQQMHCKISIRDLIVATLRKRAVCRISAGYNLSRCRCRSDHTRKPH